MQSSGVLLSSSDLNFTLWVGIHRSWQILLYKAKVGC